MAIGVLFPRRLVKLAGLLALAFLLPILQAGADDLIKKKDGTTISGQIAGVSGDQIAISIRNSNGSPGKTSCYITDVQSITMAPPAAVANLKGAAPADVIAALEPLVKQFGGLPADWVVDAMGQLANAYAAVGQADRAVATYNQIDTFYPGSKYHAQAVSGKAGLSLKQGKIDEALAAVQPIVDQANQDIAPSPSDGALYAKAFLVQGQALEAQKKPRDALKAYLTVKTMFYQNPDLAQQAEQLARNLRDQNPGLGVE